MPTADDVRWFKSNFGSDIQAAVAGTPFDVDMIVAIACQETGYIWSVLRKKGLPVDRVAALCVGDTIDYRGPGKGRQAFPRSKGALIAKPNGQEMFNIARQALVDMSGYIAGYSGAVSNPDKFCHGYGIFQRDLQFFLDDPGYFLAKKYETFKNTLALCLEELQRGLKKRGLEDRKSLTDFEFATVAIAYNKGSYDPSRKLQQGYFDGTKYYGEYISEYVQLARQVSGAAAAPTAVVAPPRASGASERVTMQEPLQAGCYAVIARGGLKLRGGPSTSFGSEKTLPLGTELTVISVDADDPAWVLVDLDGDDVLDGYVFSAFLAPIQPETSETAPEPN